MKIRSPAPTLSRSLLIGVALLSLCQVPIIAITAKIRDHPKGTSRSSISIGLVLLVRSLRLSLGRVPALATWTYFVVA